MYILGLSCFYHDASATLLKDGVIIAAAQEERFTRIKHDTSFPVHAVEYCLKSAGITINEVNFVGFYEKPILKFERMLYQHLAYFPKSTKTFLSALPAWFGEKLRVPTFIKKKLKYKGEVLFIEHHLAHAASSFLVSPFERAAIVTVDGVGEWTTTTIGKGEHERIELLKEIRFPHSVGLLYSTITAYLGFSVNNSEYKVMGLAPYGMMDREKNSYYHKLKQVIDIKPDGSYRLKLNFFKYHYADRMPSPELCTLLGGAVRKPEDELLPRHKDIAAAVQLVLEDVLTLILREAHRVTGCDSVVLAGGVALNSVYNGKILRNTPFKKVWIQPDSGDGGTSLGAAAYIYTSILGNKRKFVLKDAYLGPEFSTKEIQTYLDTQGIQYKTFQTDTELIEKTADLLAENNVIGWFQGRMEWGPRALGARSILSNPCNPEMQAILNLKVKHREKFRPFAPVVCADDAPTYFECDMPVPEATDFMLMVYPIKKEWQSKIPAVTHVDGSGRLQTIRREQNARYYDLVKSFGKRTGIPILINTSFNIRGEPIVCTPEDAYRCMMGTGIDYLIMDNFIIKREDNSKDKWDSEIYATD